MSETLEKETARVEAFSDGVFAIAITLLILEIKVPHLPPGSTNSDLFRALVALWPSFLAFLASFAAVLIMWINHHGLFRMIRRTDSRFLYANGFLLLMITFVPFPTAVLAQYLGKEGEHAAVAFYTGTFVVNSISWNFLWDTAVGRGLLKKDVPDALVARIRHAYRWGLVVYVGSTLLALWNANLGLGVCLSLWFLWSILDYRAER